MRTELKNLVLGGAVLAAAGAGTVLGAAAVVAGIRTHQEMLGNPLDPILEGSFTPEPLPYIFDPDTDFLAYAGELEDGMEAIEEEHGDRRCQGGDVLISQTCRAQELFRVENFTDRLPALPTSSVEFDAVWDDGYREHRRMIRQVRFIARQRPVLGAATSVREYEVDASDFTGPATGHRH